MKKYFGIGFLLAGAAVGAGATVMALVKRQKREQVYHEAELAAMNELDDLLAENESACAGCAAGEDCCGVDKQISISEDTESPETPAQDDAAEQTLAPEETQE